MNKETHNKNLVMRALDEAFNKRNLKAYNNYWSPNYIQHSAVIPPGLNGLKEAMSSLLLNSGMSQAGCYPG